MASLGLQIVCERTFYNTLILQEHNQHMAVAVAGVCNLIPQRHINCPFPLPHRTRQTAQYRLPRMRRALVVCAAPRPRSYAYWLQ